MQHPRGKYKNCAVSVVACSAAAVVAASVDAGGISFPDEHTTRSVSGRASHRIQA